MEKAAMAVHPNASGCVLGLELVGASSGGRFNSVIIRPPANPGGFRPGITSSFSTWHTDSSFSSTITGQQGVPGPRGVDGDNPNSAFDKFGGDPGYLENQFLALQFGLSYAILNASDITRKAAAQLENLSLQRFPYPDYRTDPLHTYFTPVTIPIFLMFGLYLSISGTVSSIVVEKERRLRAIMQLAGVTNAAHWAAWFIRAFVQLAVSMVLTTFATKVGGDNAVFPSTDTLLLLIFFVLFAAALASMCLFVSVFFQKSSTASYLSFLFVYALYFPSYAYSSVGPGGMSALCLLPSAAMGVGIRIISLYEVDTSTTGLNWSTMSDAIDGDLAPFSSVLWMFIVDIILYALLAWYFDHLFPGDFGFPKSKAFFLTRKFWMGTNASVDLKKARLAATGDETQLEPLLNSLNDSSGGCSIKNEEEFFERMPATASTGVCLTRISKQFKENGGHMKKAVDELSLTLFEGQITALLGHNGAGKTTLMSIVTGLFPQTEGQVHVCGINIDDDLSGVQQNLGFCPQTNVLWDNLTVKEHLTFFCGIKQTFSRQEISERVDSMICDLGLNEKRDALAVSLSGGQKRRLNCGIALVGGAKVVLLDEPTSGCDPAARREIWGLLERHKEGRTILLSTHFMDEADYLGDRIAVMASGKINCCGSPLFLKKAYGVGYTIRVQQIPGAKICTGQTLCHFVQKYVPAAKLVSDVGTEIMCLLPDDATATFPTLFRELGKSIHDLGIESYSVSISSMEQVFTKAGREIVENERNILKDQGDASFRELESETDSSALLDVNLERGSPDTKNTGAKLMKQQFWALVRKRKLLNKRSKLVKLAQLLYPIILSIVSVILAPKSDSGVGMSSLAPPRKLFSLECEYGSNTIMVGGNVSRMELDYIAKAAHEAQPLSDVRSYVNESLFSVAKGIAQENIVAFNRHHLVGLTMDMGHEAVPTAWFNGQGFHTIAAALATAVNTLAFVTQNNLTTFTTTANGDLGLLEFTNFPLPMTTAEKVVAASQGSNSQEMASMGSSLTFAVGISFLTASFAILATEERSCGSKHMQMTSGASLGMYYCSMLAWDFTAYLLVSAVCLIIVGVGSGSPLTSQETLASVSLLVILFGMSAIAVCYLLSFVTSKPHTSLRVVSMFQTLIGLGPIIASSFVSQSTIDLLDQVFVWHPLAMFGRGLNSISTNYMWHKAATVLVDNDHCGGATTVASCCDSPILAQCTSDYLSMNGINAAGFFALALAIQAMIFTLFLWAHETGFAKRLIHCRANPVASGNILRTHDSLDDDDVNILRAHDSLEDDDVIAEQKRIHQEYLSAGTSINKHEEYLSAGTSINKVGADAVVLANLCKNFLEKAAVNNVSVGIPMGECFGLLGVNGAGKTTLFKMITGDLTPDYGTALIHGHDVNTHLEHSQRHIGYVPQFDALLGDLTSRETLQLVAALRGIPHENITAEVDRLITSLDLTTQRDKLEKTYSGGNKRKLSVASALVGSPPVVLLDEPTTGMDPKARRLIWSTIVNIVKGGRSVILTTHSMEECEALCTRLTIMVNGRLRVLGSQQQLYNKFGQGYTITAQASSGDITQQFVERIKQHFGESKCTLRSSSTDFVADVVVNDPGISLASLFEFAESAKSELQFENYSVGQTTLEQIFLEFAKEQENGDSSNV